MFFVLRLLYTCFDSLQTPLWFYNKNMVYTPSNLMSSNSGNCDKVLLALMNEQRLIPFLPLMVGRQAPICRSEGLLLPCQCCMIEPNWSWVFLFSVTYDLSLSTAKGTILRFWRGVNPNSGSDIAKHLLQIMSEEWL
ncbi:hypothetical protein T06_4688 [Trichinella sp. T6]|nr:hypothetical protein T06_4688 [Trichinella sp. T6]